MKVRTNSLYRYTPQGYDRIWTHSTAQHGQVVRVVKYYGCPPPNTMGHCHIADRNTRKPLGLVDTRSLSKL